MTKQEAALFRDDIKHGIIDISGFDLAEVVSLCNHYAIPLDDAAFNFGREDCDSSGYLDLWVHSNKYHNNLKL